MKLNRYTEDELNGFIEAEKITATNKLNILIINCCAPIIYTMNGGTIFTPRDVHHKELIKTFFLFHFHHVFLGKQPLGLARMQDRFIHV